MIAIDRRAGALGTQIYEHYRRLVLAGTLKEGIALPPSRVLAEDIKVSRNTVLEAYDQLTAEGFVEARQGAGLYVAALPGLANNQVRPKTTHKAVTSALMKRVREMPEGYLRRHRRQATAYEFLYGEPSYEDFPQESWARTLGKVARTVKPAHLSYPDYQGLKELRESLAGYLARARGIETRPENLVVVHGTQEAIDLCCRLLIDPGDPVICEHPLYRGFLKASLAAGAEVDYVDVDHEGIVTSDLPEQGKLAFVTPSHQFPTGAVLPIARRLELIAWAEKCKAMLFEDDYDSEFRYSGAPIASLKSLDNSGCVIYTGTVSKTFFPALRLGWMIVPDHLIDAVVKLKAISDTSPPAMEQLAFASFIDSGQFERHIFRVRKRYAEKRRLLLDEFEVQLGNKVEIRGSDAGIHVLVRIPGLRNRFSQALLDRCAARGVTLHTSDMYYKRKPKCVELVMGYNAVPLLDVRKGASIVADEISRLITDQQG